MKQSIYDVLSRTGVQRVKVESGIVYRLLLPLTCAVMGALLAGGLLWWGNLIAEVIAR